MAGFAQQEPHITRATEFLNEEGWPRGLTQTFLRNQAKIPVRFVLLDDSGSMTALDGSKLIRTDGKIIKNQCTRWEELKQFVDFFANVANILKAKTNFRFINRETSKSFTIGANTPDDSTNFNSLKTALDESPLGGTLMVDHLNTITDEIEKIKEYLIENNQKACVILAVDGEASEGSEAVKQCVENLSKLPVWMVVRLFTNNKKVIKFWNEIDNDKNSCVDVLDDFNGEAKEVYRKAGNKWLNYGLPLHRLRGFGTPLEIFDEIDEAPLTPHQIVTFCHYLYGVEEGVMHPPSNINNFIEDIQHLNENCGVPRTYNVNTENTEPWINCEKLRTYLDAYYGTSG